MKWKRSTCRLNLLVLSDKEEYSVYQWYKTHMYADTMWLFSLINKSNYAMIILLDLFPVDKLIDEWFYLLADGLYYQQSESRLTVSQTWAAYVRVSCSLCDTWAATNRVCRQRRPLDTLLSYKRACSHRRVHMCAVHTHTHFVVSDSLSRVCYLCARSDPVLSDEQRAEPGRSASLHPQPCGASPS